MTQLLAAPPLIPGWLTLRQVADNHKLPYATVSKRSHAPSVETYHLGNVKLIREATIDTAPLIRRYRCGHDRTRPGMLLGKKNRCALCLVSALRRRADRIEGGLE